MRYRKKPVIVEAIQYDGSNGEKVKEWAGDNKKIWEEYDVYVSPPGVSTCRIKVITLEGKMYAYPGDWIIRGIEGEYYPCKPSIFEKTYEVVED